MVGRQAPLPIPIVVDREFELADCPSVEDLKTTRFGGNLSDRT